MLIVENVNLMKLSKFSGLYISAAFKFLPVTLLYSNKRLIALLPPFAFASADAPGRDVVSLAKIDADRLLIVALAVSSCACSIISDAFCVTMERNEANSSGEDKAQSN